MDESIKELIQKLLGDWTWLLIVGIIVLTFRKYIENIVSALMIFIGHDFDEDDVIYISGRKARILRISLRKTTFYMYDRQTKMMVPNEQLKELTLEKKMPD